MERIKVMFVCLGNICRSPLAEAIFKQKLNEKGLESRFEVASSGTASYHVNEEPDPRTIKVAHKNGVPIEHLGQQLRKADLAYFDHILAMDKSNIKNIEGLGASQYRAKIQLMRNFDPEFPGAEVPDPWYGGEDGFDQCFEILERSCSELLNSLLKD